VSVVLVAGPPCAGKTTYVTRHAEPGDVVLDQDALGPKRFAAELGRLRPEVRTWVIRCLPGPAAREAFARRVGAERTVYLCPPEHVLMSRASARPRAHVHRAAVREWIKREAQDKSSTRTSPEPRIVEWWA
jgi:hypothetical protein